MTEDFERPFSGGGWCAFFLGRLAASYRYSAKVNPYTDMGDKLQFERGFTGENYEAIQGEKRD